MLPSVGSLALDGEVHVGKFLIVPTFFRHLEALGTVLGRDPAPQVEFVFLAEEMDESSHPVLQKFKVQVWTRCPDEGCISVLLSNKT